MFLGGPLTVGPSTCPFLVGLSSGEVFGDLGAVMSSVRVHLEQNQPASKIMDADLLVLPQVSTVDEDLLHAVVEVRDWVSWPLGPSLESAGGGSYVCQGNFVVDPAVSRMIGLGLPMNHLHHSQSFQARVYSRNSNS
jgi:hypothetical protein